MGVTKSGIYSTLGWGGNDAISILNSIGWQVVVG